MSIDQKAVTGGRESLEKKNRGVDIAGVIPGLSFHNVGIKLPPFNTNEDKYNKAQFVKEESGKPDVKTARQMYAPNADKPTTASGDASKKLPEIIKKVDPMAASQALKAMFTALSLVRSLMSSSSPAPRRKTITDALSGALCILSKEFGFDTVIYVMNQALENDGLYIISVDYREIVKGAVADLIAKALEYGADNLPVTEYPTLGTTISSVTLPGSIVDVVPDLYKQVYYTVETDPIPGFIQWVSPEGNEFVYTVRPSDQPYCSSAEEEIYANCEQELAKNLRPYFIEKNLTAEILNQLLIEQDRNVEQNGMDKAMGKNAGANLMGLLPQLLGILSTTINLTQSLHLPNSVLNQGSVGKTLQDFSKNMAIIKKMKADSLPAFNMPNPLAGIPGLSGLAGGLGGLAGGLGGLGGLAGGLGSIGGIAGTVSGLASGNLGAITNVVSGISGINPSTIGQAASLVNKIVS